MTIKEQNSSLYYYLLDCKDIIIRKSKNKELIETLVDTSLIQITKIQMQQLISEATKLRLKEINQLK